MTVFAELASAEIGWAAWDLVPCADTGGRGIACLGGVGGVDAGCQPDAECGGREKPGPFGHVGGLVLAGQRAGERRGEPVAEGLGPGAQEGPAALVFGDRIDHEAAPPGLAVGAEERGEPGEEALDVAVAGAGAFHGGEPGADEAAEVAP